MDCRVEGDGTSGATPRRRWRGARAWMLSGRSTADSSSVRRSSKPATIHIQDLTWPAHAASREVKGMRNCPGRSPMLARVGVVPCDDRWSPVTCVLLRASANVQSRESGEPPPPTAARSIRPCRAVTATSLVRSGQRLSRGTACSCVVSGEVHGATDARRTSDHSGRPSAAREKSPGRMHARKTPVVVARLGQDDHLASCRRDFRGA